MRIGVCRIVRMGASAMDVDVPALGVQGSVLGSAGRIVVLVGLLLAGLGSLYADDRSEIDPDRMHVKALWWFSNPSGYFKSDGKDGGDSFDLHRDLGFGSYSTFFGSVDWRMTRRQHLLFGVSPINSTRRTTLTRTISFQGETYDVGTSVVTDIRSYAYVPGYQFDIMRRHRGYLGLAAQFFMLDTSATMTGTVTVNGQDVTRRSSGSVFAPIPVVGPRSEWFPFGSRRFDVAGSLQGMYLFGYGDLWTSQANADFGLSRHWYLTAGYQVGTRLTIHGGENQIGIRLTQKGPVAGVQVAW